MDFFLSLDLLVGIVSTERLTYVGYYGSLRIGSPLGEPKNLRCYFSLIFLAQPTDTDQLNFGFMCFLVALFTYLFFLKVIG